MRVCLLCLRYRMKKAGMHTPCECEHPRLTRPMTGGIAPLIKAFGQLVQNHDSELCSRIANANEEDRAILAHVFLGIIARMMGKQEFLETLADFVSQVAPGAEDSLRHPPG